MAESFMPGDAGWQGGQLVTLTPQALIASWRTDAAVLIASDNTAARCTGLALENCANDLQGVLDGTLVYPSRAYPIFRKGDGPQMTNG